MLATGVLPLILVRALVPGVLATGVLPAGVMPTGVLYSGVRACAAAVARNPCGGHVRTGSRPNLKPASGNNLATQLQPARRVTLRRDFTPGRQASAPLGVVLRRSGIAPVGKERSLRDVVLRLPEAEQHWSVNT